MKALTIAAALLLAACAPRVQGGNENSVIVGPASEGEAFTIAADHCAKYGRTPRLTGMTEIGSRVMFDCVG